MFLNMVVNRGLTITSTNFHYAAYTVETLTDVHKYMPTKCLKITVLWI